MIRTALLLALLPVAASAHPGYHLHPHGGELPAWLLVAAIAGAAAFAALRWRGRR